MLVLGHIAVGEKTNPCPCGNPIQMEREYKQQGNRIYSTSEDKLCGEKLSRSRECNFKSGDERIH